MKIKQIAHNNRRRGFEVVSPAGTYWFPYAKLEVRVERGDRVVRVLVDEEIGGEGFTYVLASGKEGTVHLDAVLEYNRDPSHVRDMLLYKLTLDAQHRLETSGLSRREIIRRLGTSPAQFYRLLDQTNDRKSVDQMIKLLTALDCKVDVVVG